MRRADGVRLGLEATALAAIALVALPVPVGGAMLLVAALSLALGGERFAEVGPPWTVGVGMLVGAVAAATVVLAAAPLLAGASGLPVAFTVAPMVRGNSSVFIAVAILGAVTTLAGELALRGWLLPRLRRLGLTPWVAIAAVVLVEAALTPGPWPQRAGVATIGLGASVLSVAAGGRIGAPIAAAVTLQVLLLAVEWQKLRS